jgi:bacillithiol biosynthesis cysteine-adding enzyme BshC
LPESIFAALLAGRAEAQRLLPGRFQDPEAWRAAADVASARRVAPGLLDELDRQSAALPPSPSRERSLERLAQPGTTVVVTGQQIGLFGGPLYTLHKAATAIARARQVEAWTGRPCVPLFWLQTEDHDYAEIAEVSVPTPAGRVTFALPPDPAPSRVSVAHRVVPPAVPGILAELEATVAPLPHSTEVVALLCEHYVPGRSLAAAFAGLLSALWKDEGLLVLDPRVAAVARLAAPLLRRTLGEHAAISGDLAARAAAIVAVGCDEQVRTREDASLVFFHPEGVDGPRYRLVRRGGGWETPAGSISDLELGGLLEREPLRFSTSALLRPLVQDSILPTCAVVGGPAEVSYFAQLAPVYARLGVPMPLIAPRARLRVLDASTRSLLHKLGLDAADVKGPRALLLARVATRPEGSPTAADLRQRLLGPLESELAALAALGLDNLDGPIRKALQSCSHTLGKLAERAERAASEQDQVAASRLDRVIATLCPGDIPQERAYGFAALASHVGTGTLLRAILEGAASLDPAVRDVSV